MRRTPQRPRIWESRTCCRAAIVTGCESDSMLALGIDLAAQPSNTGAVFLESAGEPWRAFELEEVPTNDALIGAARRADVLGVDAPFGWPIDFVEAVSAHGAFEGWPGGENRERLTHRETDRAVQERSSLHPLSCPPTSSGPLPCAARFCSAGGPTRYGVVVALNATDPTGWSKPTPPPRFGSGACRARATRTVKATRRWSDDVLDALVCALIAIACKAGAT